jgi:nicotinate-nucleotide--dimethylbenzimidazole phosphoribosyltransferase
LEIKKNIVNTVINKMKNIDNPYEILSIGGGLEIGQIAGGVLACYDMGIPAVIDGLICTSGALISCLLNPKVTDVLFAGHKSLEPSHIHSLKKMNLKPLLDLNMRLGEGTGAVLAMNIIEASTKIINEMSSFESAGVSKENE